MKASLEMSTPNNRIVYIRPVADDSLPEEIRKAAPVAAELYAIHGEDGVVLGVAPSRELAFVAARANELAPLSVH